MTKGNFVWGLLLILAGGQLLGVPEAGATEFVVEAGGDIATALDQGIQYLCTWNKEDFHEIKEITAKTPSEIMPHI